MPYCWTAPHAPPPLYHEHYGRKPRDYRLGCHVAPHRNLPLRTPRNSPRNRTHEANCVKKNAVSFSLHTRAKQWYHRACICFTLRTFPNTTEKETAFFFTQFA